MTDTTEPPDPEGDAPAESHHEYHDWTGSASLAATIIDALGEVGAEETAPDTPLSECIDADALDALFVPTRDAAPATEGHLWFTYAGFEVTVFTSGLVCVRRRDRRRLESTGPAPGLADNA